MLIWFSLALTSVFLLVATLNVIASPRMTKSKNPKVSKAARKPFVSVLIPARNEAHQIRACVESLLASDYGDFEIIVGDDQSSDGTGAEVAALINSRSLDTASKLKLFTIDKPPPQGWTGKARTCHELAQQARGEVLIFCDADVIASRTAICGTVDVLGRYQADLVSALPQQLGGSALVQALVAIVTQFSILISLPLLLVPRSKNAALATGNGQWMAWQTEAYRRIGGHEAVKDSRIEDVSLARLAKSQGCTLVVALAARDLTVRMYESLAAARLGFRKNLFALLGDSPVAACASGLLTLGLLFSPLWAFADGQYAAGLALLTLGLSLILMQRLAFRTPWVALGGFPVGIALAVVVLCESVFYSRRGALVWKDRSLTVS